MIKNMILIWIYLFFVSFNVFGAKKEFAINNDASSILFKNNFNVTVYCSNFPKIDVFGSTKNLRKLSLIQYSTKQISLINNQDSVGFSGAAAGAKLNVKIYLKYGVLQDVSVADYTSIKIPACAVIGDGFSLNVTNYSNAFLEGRVNNLNIELDGGSTFNNNKNIRFFAKKANFRSLGRSKLNLCGVHKIEGMLFSGSKIKFDKTAKSNFVEGQGSSISRVYCGQPR